MARVRGAGASATVVRLRDRLILNAPPRGGSVSVDEAQGDWSVLMQSLQQTARRSIGAGRVEEVLSRGTFVDYPSLSWAITSLREHRRLMEDAILSAAHSANKI